LLIQNIPKINNLKAQIPTILEKEFNVDKICDIIIIPDLVHH